MSDSPSELSFTQIADAYMQLRAEGKSISVEQFADAIPELRDEILAKLPIMMLLQDTLASRNSSSIGIGAETVINGCKLETEIGRGASAVVFRAYQADFDRKVAIKVMHKQQSNWQARFEVERRAMARLDHPNIVQPYSFVQHEQYGCLIMKFVDGYSLKQLIDQDCDYQGQILASQLASDWDLFAEIAADAADAIAHAHQNGIIHRDIKPSNLLVDHNFKVWITDFGLTKLLNENLSISRTGDAVGTPRFMAPEQFQGKCDERSDIYSLGLTLYAVAAGSTQHIDRSFLESPSQSEGIDLSKLNSDIPKELARVIEKACQLDPIDRYQTADELRIVLERYSAGRVPDRRSKNRHRKRFYLRYLMKKMVMVAAVVISLGISLCVFFTLKADPTDSTRAQAAQSKGDELVLNETLLDEIVDGKSRGINVLFKDFVRRHIDDAATNISLSVEETNKLHSHIESLIPKDIYEDSIAGVSVTLRERGFSNAARLLRLIRIVQRSSLPKAEKHAGIESVRQLAYLVAKKHIDQSEADEIEKILTFDRLMSAQELNKTRFADHRVRVWLVKVQERVRDEAEVEDINNEIDALFEDLKLAPHDEA